ncbi:MAG: hypothetical protein R3C39_09560 [Dehalococcoidia bacterium]
MSGRPAPVVTPEGFFGEPPPDLDAYEAYDAGTSPAVLRFLGVMLTLVAGAWLAVFSLAQATSEDVAIEAQARGLAVLTEADALVAFEAPALEAQLDEGATSLEVPGFPAPAVTVPASEVTGADGALDLDAVSARLLDGAAERAYESGSDALRPEGVSEGGERSVDLVMDLLTRSWHQRARLVALLAGGAAVVLGVLLVLLGHDVGRFVGPGVALFVAGLLTVLGALAVRFVISALGPGADDPVLHEYASVVGELTRLPLRNGLVLAAAGLAMALPAAVLARRA